MRQRRADVGQRRGNRRARSSAVALMTVALLALIPASANAAAGLSVGAELPARVAVGDRGVAGSVVLTNTNTGGDTSTTICNAGDTGDCAGSEGVTLVPACGATSLSLCTPAGADPGVVSISATATGSQACVGMAFTVSVTDATYGKVRFMPTGGQHIALPTPGSICRINFTFGVLMRPANDAQVTAGRQTRQLVEAGGTTAEGGQAFNRSSSSLVTVTLAAPAVTDTDPDSPANDNSPEVKGSTPAGTVSVALYTDSACTGPVAATGTVAAFTAPGLTVNVPDDASRTFYATGIDADLGVTPCSATGLTYVEDSTPPAAPVLSDTDPDSPANDNGPRVKGSASAGTIVRLYADATCSGPVAGQGTAAAFASPGLVATVADNTTTTFRATATDAGANTSACSSATVVYVEDSAAPPAPSTSGATSPASPSNDNSPRITGTAPAGTTVKLYTDAACAGAAAGSANAATFASPGIQVTVVADTTTTFYATTTDAAGNQSPCSATGTTYVEDSAPPSAPSIGASRPTSPGNDNVPHIVGTSQSGSTVRLFTDTTCAGSVAAQGDAAAFASPGLTVTVANDSATTYYATATDAAGNTSACSSGFAYVEDSTAPTAKIDSASSTMPIVITFSSSEPGSTFQCRIDATAFAMCASPFTVPAGLSAGAHNFEVRAIDVAGNPSAASVARAFTVTASAQAPPATRAQPGCLSIRGKLYVGTTKANRRVGGTTTDIMFGLAGSDNLRGAAGVDCLYGDTGNDLLRGGAGADRLFGASGNDRLFGDAGNDRLSGQSGNDRFDGGAGNDVLTGAAGDDRLADRRGRDRFSGGSGVDRIDARDSSARHRKAVDRILCGAGRDTVLADPRDSVAKDCEKITRRSRGVPALRY